MISRPVLHSSKGFLPLFLNHIKDFSFGIETQWSFSIQCKYDHADFRHRSAILAPTSILEKGNVKIFYSAHQIIVRQ